MARDRQRAKQRKARRAAQNPGPAPSEPHRANVPGELDHSSGDQDEFEARLVAGARGGSRHLVLRAPRARTRARHEVGVVLRPTSNGFSTRPAVTVVSGGERASTYTPDARAPTHTPPSGPPRRPLPRREVSATRPHHPTTARGPSGGGAGG